MDGHDLSDGAETKICSHLQQLCGLPMLKWVLDVVWDLELHFWDVLVVNHMGKLVPLKKDCGVWASAGAILIMVRVYFPCKKVGYSRLPSLFAFHCHPYLLPSGYTWLLWKVNLQGNILSCYLFLFWDCLRSQKRNLPFDHGRYPFPGITFPRYFWLKGKPRKTSTILIKM